MKTLNQDVLNARLLPLNVSGNPILEEIRRFVIEGRDFELLAINPKRVARAHKLPPIQVVKAFLQLTQAGIFDMSWSVHCPHCTGTTTRVSSLSGLKEAAHCPNCISDFAVGFDRNVALTFRVNPSVAEIGELNDFEMFLATVETEPGIHLELDPEETHHLKMDLSLGAYGVMDKTHIQVVNLSVLENQKPTSKIEMKFGEAETQLRLIKTGPGETDLYIKNERKEKIDILFSKVSKPDWTDAALVSTLQEFRDIFSKEMLSPDENFGIQNLSIVFTDIKGSTEMYERLGDSKAFYLVKEHFKIMERIVRENEGAIVKTIGDAVMAVFSVPSNALNASRQMIDEFDEFNKENHIQNYIIVKIGIHLGSCIAVTMNERLDYFGTSVNIAARVQGLSDGRDIMVSERIFNESGAKDTMLKNGWKAEKFSTSLKGLKDDYTVFKLYRIE
jgi:adenylate cyclase